MREVAQFYSTPTGKLAATYLAIIMAMTVAFSVIIFGVTATQLHRPAPAHELRKESQISASPRMDIERYVEARVAHAKWELFWALVLLNLCALGCGAWFSIYLARKTMEPITDAMEQQVQFVSDASHELRTPLTAIKAINEVALRRKKITDTEARTLAKENIDEVTKLHELTSSLLGLVAAENHTTVAAEPVELQRIVSDALTSVVVSAQAKHITIDDTTSAAIVNGHHETLIQILRILLDNAIKYSPEKSTIYLSTQMSSAYVQLSVRDEGIGIAATHLPHIFSRFYRADSARSKDTTEGFGLGLAIAKVLSDRDNLGLAVTSTPGEGSVFYFRLPLHNHH